MSLAAGGGLAPIEIIANDKRRYPPALMGMRGSNPGSFEVAHALAWGGAKFDKPKIQTDHDYDLVVVGGCLLYTSPSPRDRQKSRMPSSA